MRWERSRRAAASYLLSFFVAVTAAPHQHVNGLEDLLFDQKSDSGIVLEVFGAASTGRELGWNPSLLVQDSPCPACFTRDFVSATAATVDIAHVLLPLPLLPAAPDAAAPDRYLAESSSRAPPRIS